MKCTNFLSQHFQETLPVGLAIVLGKRIYSEIEFARYCHGQIYNIVFLLFAEKMKLYIIYPLQNSPLSIHLGHLQGEGEVVAALRL